MTIATNCNAISTFGSKYFNFSGESPVNERVPCPVIATKTLLSKLKQIQEKTYSQVDQSSLEEDANWGKRWKDYNKKALDGLMTRELQFQFSKDGLKGKRAFSKTQHYKCLTGKS